MLLLAWLLLLLLLAWLLLLLQRSPGEHSGGQTVYATVSWQTHSMGLEDCVVADKAKAGGQDDFVRVDHVSSVS